MEPTGFMSWTPPPPTIDKPELKNMTDKNRILDEGEPVVVYIGNSVSISINNFFQANYSSIEWYIKENEILSTDSAYIVYTNESSPFHNVGIYILTVKGTNPGGSKTTTIKIDVKKPPVPKPRLMNMNKSEEVNGDEPVEVVIGFTLTISIINVEADYHKIEWKIGDEIATTDEKAIVFVVHAGTSPFNDVGKYTLIVTGIKNEVKSEPTKIYIDVKEPPPPPGYKWKDHPNAPEIRTWINTPNDTTNITGWVPNQAMTGGNVAWYKTYTGAGNVQRFEADLAIVKAFMRETNEDELWTESKMLIEPPPTTPSYMIYLRYDDLTATIRINDGSDTRTIYNFSLGSFELVDP
jgi:hypothetical protein